MAEKKLYRSHRNRMIAGVAGGLAEYLGVDPTVIRLVFILLSFAGGSGIWIYLILWVVIPEAPDGSINRSDKTESSTSEKTDTKKDEQPEDRFERPIEQRFDQAAEEIKEVFTGRGRRSTDQVIGLILILVGCFFLFGHLLPSLFDLGRLWPLIVIIAGLWIMAANRRKE